MGWVPSGMIYISIPDEVAQYAEGERISSYFDLGQVVDDEKGVKHDWLWTTRATPIRSTSTNSGYFTEIRRRHRYETAYRQKELVGFFPVHIEPAEPGRRERFFSLIFQDDAVRYLEERYVFDGALVRLVESDPYQPVEWKCRDQGGTARGRQNENRQSHRARILSSNVSSAAWCMPSSAEEPNLLGFDFPVYFNTVGRQELSHMRMLALGQLRNGSERNVRRLDRET